LGLAYSLLEASLTDSNLHNLGMEHRHNLDTDNNLRSLDTDNNLRSLDTDSNLHSPGMERRHSLAMEPHPNLDTDNNPQLVKAMAQYVRLFSLCARDRLCLKILALHCIR
jgi:hypothetical protein